MMTRADTRPAGETVTVRQVRSGIGFSTPQNRTLKALGLGRIGRERTHPDNPAIRGMITSVRHLVDIVEPSDRVRTR